MITRAILVLALASVPGVTALAAQATREAVPQIGPGTVFAGPPRATAGDRPRVDPLTALIRGRVTAADNGAPLRGAEVRALSETGVNRIVTTDTDGRFELRDLPAGRFTLTASRSGYVSLQFGQRRPFEVAKAIELAEGANVAADVALPRGGVIAGRVYDAFGEPQAGARMQALRSRTVQGQGRLQTVGPGDETDDTGAFRLYGLPPGDYYVVARPPGTPGQPARNSVPIYFPGTLDVAEAQSISLEPGAEASAVFQLTPLRAARVSGVVLDSAGVPANATVNLASSAVGLGYVNAAAGEIPLMISAHTGGDGTFVLTGVPPGRYELRATLDFAPGAVEAAVRNLAEERRGQGAGGAVAVAAPPMLREMATVPVVVTSEDLTGITVVTGEGGSISGTFVRDAGVTQPLPPGLGVRMSGGGASMQQRGSNTFRLFGVNGPVRLEVDGLPEGWAMKAILVDNADVTDAPIILKNGLEVTARIVLTNRVTELSGAITSRAPSRSHSVVVFPEDAAKRAFPSRYTRTVRADGQGRFRITGLPPEEGYLAFAVDYLEEGEGDDPEFLEQMRDRATSFSFTAAGRASLELQLVQR